MKNQSDRIVSSLRTPRRAGGFTLVELLVTITIIVVLAALTMTVTQKIRASAYRANAMSAMRQVAAFNVSYATENNGDINTLRWAEDPKEGTPSWIKNTFWGRVQPYMFPDAVGENTVLQKAIKQRLDGLFNTNTAKLPKEFPGTVLSGTRIYRDESGLAVPFSFNNSNSAMVPWNKFAKMSSFEDASQILYFTYGSGMFDETDGMAYEPMPSGGSAIKNNIYYLDDRKALAAFLDGHIESLSAPIPSRRFR